MKIVILDAHASNPGDLSWGELEQYGQVTVYPRTAPHETLERMRDADIVYVNKTPITEEILAGCPKLKMIGILATGYNIVDVEACRRRGIPVCNVPGYSTMAVAQMTFALLLEMTQQVGRHSSAVHGGAWQSCPDFCFWETALTELAGKTFGIIGYGAIGQAVGRIALAFGMKLLVTARSPKTVPEGAKYVSLEALLSESDIVSLHCPQTAENAGLIGEAALGRMKDGAILLNTARGGLIEEAAVAEALKSGKLAFYGADVVSREPISPTNPLLGAPNCFLTPHIAWAPRQTRIRLHHIAAENLRLFLEGKPQNVVNP